MQGSLWNFAFASILSHKLTCILHPFFNSAQQEIVVKWRWLKSSPLPGGMRAVMNKGKNIKSILQWHNARLIPTEALRPAPCLNQMIVCAQQKPICFPLTLMVLAMALSSPVITTFYFIHASLLQARVLRERLGSGTSHPAFHYSLFSFSARDSFLSGSHLESTECLFPAGQCEWGGGACLVGAAGEGLGGGGVWKSSK